MSHAWLPRSDCGAGCVPRTTAVTGAVRAAVRSTVAAALLCALPLVLLGARMSGPTGGSRVRRGYARTLLRAFGLRLRVRDDRGAVSGTVRDNAQFDDDAPVLLVAGHVSWADVLAVSALRPASFVARADLLDWPLIGSLARRIRVIPIDRESLRGLPTVVARTTETLRSGRSVAVFPEGTTWCGRRHGEFRPALFQAAVDAGVPVQPVALRYLDADGRCTTVPCFVGDETMPRALLRMLCARPVTVEVRLTPPERIADPRAVTAADARCAVDRVHRRELAARTQAVVLAG